MGGGAIPIAPGRANPVVCLGYHVVPACIPGRTNIILIYRSKMGAVQQLRRLSRNAKSKRGRGGREMRYGT